MSYVLRTSSRLALPSLAGLSLVALMVTLPARADAQVCASNSDCPVGTTCQQTSVPSAEPGCAGPDCPVAGTGGSAGKALVAPDAARMTCAPAPCQVDADCGTQMICHTETHSVCSGGTPTACGRDMKCEAAAPPTCTETKVSTCAYKWQQPCRADADCGDGFTCEPNVITTCSGGSAGPVSGGTTGSVGTGASAPLPVGAGGSSGSTEPSDAPARVTPATDGGTTEMCTTTSSFPGWCRAKATTCNTDADCPAPWTCVDGNPSGGVSGGGTIDLGNSGSGTGAAAPATTGSGGAAPPSTTLVAQVKVCQSPVSFPVRGGVATDVGGPNGAPSGSGAPSGGGGLTSGDGTSAPEVATTHGSNAGCAVAGKVASPLAGFVALMLGLALASGRRGRHGRDRG
jgi:Cys-rich repeat protein